MNNSQLSYAGLELGAVSLKFAIRLPNGKTQFEIVRHGGNPSEAVRSLLDKYPVDSKTRIAVTGETAKGLLNLPYFPEVECLERALSYFNLEPDILLSLGGETFTIYTLKDREIKNIISTSRCQAGSGEFLLQQFQRMGFSITDGIEASKKGNIVKLASRCSVHCKSDSTHKLNKGECTPNDIAKTLIHDLAKRVSEMIEMAQWATDRVVVTGGVSMNDEFIANLKEFLPDSDIIVLNESSYLESFGASLLASELSDFTKINPTEDYLKSDRTAFETLSQLNRSENLLDFRVRDRSHMKVTEGGTYILGVDAGSTTTKMVLFDIEDGSIGASEYLRTLGNPVQATIDCLQRISQHIEGKNIKIIQCGVTGSAREMVSVYLDNCLSYNEILAHARSAIEVVPEVDTVFEIGGQDSKFISFQGGIPIDYAMNEGCSAGTGSFLEESASVDMKIPMEKLSPIAETSKNPIAFGERCAAFINTDLRNALQQGAKKEDVAAGLVYSIADNYISRIVGPRFLGETILFLGGVALNRAVGLALGARSQRRVVVPAHPELMGAIGSALMTLDLLREGSVQEENYSLESLAEGEMEVEDTFRCAACENNCEIQRIRIRGKVYPFGGLCSKYWLQRNKSKRTKGIRDGRDVVSLRNKLMFEDFGPRPIRNPRGRIGIPMGLTAYEIFPFFAKLWNELGYETVTSEYDKAYNVRKDVRAPICYPCELVHSGVRDLLEKNVDFIFLPYVIEMEYSKPYIHGYTCSNTVVIPDVIRSAFEENKDKILKPHLSFGKGHRGLNIKEIERLAPILGIKRNTVQRAVISAYEHYNDFRQRLNELGKNELEELKNEPIVILAGRPYVICSADVNLALPRKIISRGYHVLPMDCIPNAHQDGIHPRNVWSFTQQINNAIAFAKNEPNVYLCFVSCFSCGIDATMYHHFRQQLEGRTFCYLEIDSHTAHAGFDTRVGAFLEIIEERGRKEEIHPQIGMNQRRD